MLAQADNPPHSPLAPSHFLGRREGQQDLRREELPVCLGKRRWLPERWLCQVPGGAYAMCRQGFPQTGGRPGLGSGRLAASGTAADSW